MSKRPERQGIMLAHPFSEKRLAALGLPFIAQPKLNGERCWVAWFNGEPSLISSYGNEFKLPHITEALTALNREYQFDGELYIHGESFETIHSIASASRKELHPDWEKMEFHIFDIKTPKGSQIIRQKILENCPLQWPLKRVETLICQEASTAGDLVVRWVAEGYEGIILRSILRCYEERRSPGLIKYKPTEQDDYLIVGVTEGEGWCEGMLGSLQVKSIDHDTVFSVGSGRLLTKENRKILWQRREELIGKTLIVKHEALTTRGGIPKCAVATTLKED